MGISCVQVLQARGHNHMQAISSTAVTRILCIQTFAREKLRKQVVPFCLPLLFGLGVKVRREDAHIAQPMHAAGTFEYSERFLPSWQDFICLAVTVCAILSPPLLLHCFVTSASDASPNFPSALSLSSVFL